MPKISEMLLCSDIDGTALRASEGIPPQNIEAVQRFVSLGGHFTFATGRVTKAAEPVIKKFSVNAPLIIANGAMICEAGSMRVLEEHKMSEKIHETAEELVRRFDGRAAVIIADGSCYCPVAPSKESIRLARTHLLVHMDCCKIESAPSSCHKILLLAADRQQAEQIRKETADLEKSFGVVVSGSRLVELIPPDVDKGRGMRTVAGMLGIAPENTAAIGDNENDLPLLLGAAFSAAPADAAPEVCTQVGRVVCGCMEGALAMFIEELIALCK